MNNIKYKLSLILGVAFIMLQSNQIKAQACDTILADFSSNAPRCTGADVDFVFTQNVYGTVTYDWNFGSGATPATSTALNPTGIVYSSAGLKLVTLTINHPGLSCTDIKTSGINIIEMPAPVFTDNGPQCEEAAVNFTYTGTSNPSWLYSWDFGTGSNPSVSSAQNPAGVLYTGPGTKSVTVTVSNGQCAANATQNVTIQNKPDANFTAVANSCTNDSVNFTNLGTTGVTYAWDFGTGASPATSTGENPQDVFYSSSGSKTIQQIVTQGSCADTTSMAINVTETPAPAFTTNAPQCEGADVNFTYSGSSGTGWTYAWDFGSGSSPSVSTAADPQGITYTGSGTKSVSLTVTNASCSEIITQNITINQTPTSGFSNSSPACTIDSVNFSNTGNTGITYAWDFGSGASPATSTSENPLGIMYATPGIKTVRQIATIATCRDTTFNNVSVTETPVPNYTHNAPQCEGAVVNFTYTGTSGSGWTYLWDFGTGSNPSLSAGQNPTGVNYTGSGGKTVTLTVTNQLCSETFTGALTINATPTAGFSSNAPGCTTDSINFLNGGTTGQTYAWDFGSGASPATSTSENPIGIIYSTSGIKTIQQIITQGTCVDTSTTSINLTEMPAPTFTHTAPQCEGAQVDYTYTGTTGTGWTYLWDFGTGASPSLSTAQNPLGVEYTGSGTKTVTLTVTNQLCSETVSQSITINPTPTAGFGNNAPGCTTDSINFLNGGTTGQTYAWDFGAGASPATSTDESPIGIIYNTPGVKTVQQIITQGTCTDTAWSSISLTEMPAPAISHNAPQCEGAAVNFAHSGTTGTGWTYLWDFGNGANPSLSTATNPNGIEYTGSGIKTVTLTVSNQLCAETITTTFVIAGTPTSGFSSNAPGCTGDSINFVNSGTSGMVYSWDFGSGASPATSTAESPQGIIYSSPGIKIVKQIITQGSCLDSTISYLNLTETPTPDFTHNGPKCEGENVNFTYGSSTGTGWTYSWDFGSGANPPISSAQNPPAITYTGSGSKTITVSVENSGCVASFDSVLTVNFLPTASISSNAPGCSGDTVLFSNSGTTGVGGTSYLWDFGSATPTSSTMENPGGVVFAIHGVKTVVFSVTVGMCSDTAVENINIDETPSISILSNAPVCAREAVSFVNQGSNGTKWNFIWDFGAGANPSLSTSETPSGIKYNKGGQKKVSLSISDAKCSNNDTVLISIRSLPISNAGEDVTICADRCIQLGDTATIGYTYSWFPSSTLDSDSNSNPMACPRASVNSYTVTTTDTSGCISSDTVVVTMLQSAIAKAGSDVNACFGDSLQIGAALIEGQTYQWIPSVGLSNDTVPSPMAKPDSTTIYTLLVSYKGCDSIADKIVFTVHDDPVVSAGADVTIAVGEKTQLIATGAIMYEWSPPDGLSNPGIARPVASPLETTTYVVLFTDVNSCQSEDSVTVSIVETDIWTPDAFTPNGDGKNDFFYIRANGASTFEFRVFNRNGELIFRTTDPNQGWDGTRQGTGQKMPTGAYVFSAKGRLSDSDTFDQSGMINLIR